MNDLRPQQIADLKKKIEWWKGQSHNCAANGMNREKRIIDRRIEGMEDELQKLTGEQ